MFKNRTFFSPSAFDFELRGLRDKKYLVVHFLIFSLGYQTSADVHIIVSGILCCGHVRGAPICGCGKPVPLSLTLNRAHPPKKREENKYVCS